MEEDTSRFPKRRNSRRSSILKSPTRTQALGDLDLNAPLQNNLTRLSNRRVSFAETYQIKEFAKDSPQIPDNVPPLETDVQNTTDDIGQAPGRQISGLDKLLHGTLFNQTLDDTHEIKELPLPKDPDGSSLLSADSMETQTGSYVQDRPSDALAPKVSMTAFLEKLKGKSDAFLPEDFTPYLPSQQLKTQYCKGVYNITDKTDFATIMNTSLNKFTTSPPSLIAKAVVDGSISTRYSEIHVSSSNAVTREENISQVTGNANRGTGKIDFKQFLQRLNSSHTVSSLSNESCAKTTPVERCENLARGGKLNFNHFVQKLNQGDSVVPVISKDSCEYKESWETPAASFSVSAAERRKPVSVPKHQPADDKENIHVFAGDLQDSARNTPSETETRVDAVSDYLERGVMKSSDVTRIFSGLEQDADMDMTACHGNIKTDRTLNVHNKVTDMTQDEVFYGMEEDGGMNMTECHGNINVDRTRPIQQANNVTNIFSGLEEDAGMEMTGCHGNINVDRTGPIQQSSNVTKVFSGIEQDAGMEMTTCHGNINVDKTGPIQQPSNLTKVFSGLEEDAGMEMTGCHGNINVDRTGPIQQSSNVTKVFSGIEQDAGMEMTTCHGNINVDKTGPIQQPSNLTKVFSGLEEDAGMEMTGCHGQLHGNINVVTIQSSNVTKVFSGIEQDAEMEMTTCQGNINVDKTGPIQQSSNVTKIFSVMEHGAGMEMTGCHGNINVDRTGPIQQSSNVTKIFSGMEQDAGMEMTGCHGNINVDRTQRIRQSSNVTKVFSGLEEDAGMEMTGCHGQLHGNINVVTIQSSNVTKVFSGMEQDAGMEMTGSHGRINTVCSNTHETEPNKEVHTEEKSPSALLPILPSHQTPCTGVNSKFNTICSRSAKRSLSTSRQSCGPLYPPEKVKRLVGHMAIPSNLSYLKERLKTMKAERSRQSLPGMKKDGEEPRNLLGFDMKDVIPRSAASGDVSPATAQRELSLHSADSLFQTLKSKQGERTYLKKSYLKNSKSEGQSVSATHDSVGIHVDREVSSNIRTTCSSVAEPGMAVFNKIPTIDVVTGNDDLVACAKEAASIRCVTAPETHTGLSNVEKPLTSDILKSQSPNSVPPMTDGGNVYTSDEDIPEAYKKGDCQINSSPPSPVLQNFDSLNSETSEPFVARTPKAEVESCSGNPENEKPCSIKDTEPQNERLSNSVIQIDSSDDEISFKDVSIGLSGNDKPWLKDTEISGSQREIPSITAKHCNEISLEDNTTAELGNCEHRKSIEPLSVGKSPAKTAEETTAAVDTDFGGDGDAAGISEYQDGKSHGTCLDLEEDILKEFLPEISLLPESPPASRSLATESYHSLPNFSILKSQPYQSDAPTTAEQFMQTVRITTCLDSHWATPRRRSSFAPLPQICQEDMSLSEILHKALVTTAEVAMLDTAIEEMTTRKKEILDVTKYLEESIERDNPEIFQQVAESKEQYKEIKKQSETCWQACRKISRTISRGNKLRWLETENATLKKNLAKIYTAAEELELDVLKTDVDEQLKTVVEALRDANEEMSRIETSSVSSDEHDTESAESNIQPVVISQELQNAEDCLADLQREKVNLAETEEVLNLEKVKLERELSEVKIEKENMEEGVQEMQRKFTAFKRLMEWTMVENSRTSMGFVFLYGYIRVDIEWWIEGSTDYSNRQIDLISISSALTEEVNSETVLAHNMVTRAVTRELLNSYRQENDLPRLLWDISKLVWIGKALERDLKQIQYSHHTEVLGTSVSVYFSNITKIQKCCVTFEFTPPSVSSNQSVSAIPPAKVKVTALIGDIPVEHLQTAAEAVSPGSKYLKQMVDAIDSIITLGDTLSPFYKGR